MTRGKTEPKELLLKFLHIDTYGNVKISLGDDPESRIQFTHEVRLTPSEFAEFLEDIAKYHPDLLRRALEKQLENRLVEAITDRINDILLQREEF